MNILCCSGGNDSVALMQWAVKSKLENVVVLYNNTKWYSDGWIDRINQVKKFCEKNEFKYFETESEGFKNMVRRKKGFPMPASRMQFCSSVLKTEPTQNWLEKHDPNENAVIYMGKRREESQNRKNHPSQIIYSKEYGFRLQKFPLVFYKERERDFLILETEFDILLHGSMECFPCINSNRADLRLLANDKKRIQEIADLEKEMGFTKNKKPRVMFRPYRHMGATGIKEVVRWALCERGKYKKINKLSE